MDYTRTDVKWLPKPNSVELHFAKQVPDENLICAVFVMAFNELGEVLMVQTPKRGTFDIPGGGREGEETYIETAIRETLEEAFVHIENVEMVAYQRLHVSGAVDEHYRRPYPTAYEVFVKAQVKSLEPFMENEETTSRKFFKPKDAFTQEGILFEHRQAILFSAL